MTSVVSRRLTPVEQPHRTCTAPATRLIRRRARPSLTTREHPPAEGGWGRRLRREGGRRALQRESPACAPEEPISSDFDHSIRCELVCARSAALQRPPQVGPMELPGGGRGAPGGAAGRPDGGQSGEGRRCRGGLATGTPAGRGPGPGAARPPTPAGPRVRVARSGVGSGPGTGASGSMIRDKRG